MSSSSGAARQMIVTRMLPVRRKCAAMSSELTASGYTQEHYDISHQSIIRSLRSPELDIFLIVEPGPQPTFADLISKYPADHVIVDLQASSKKRLFEQ